MEFARVLACMIFCSRDKPSSPGVQWHKINEVVRLVESENAMSTDFPPLDIEARVNALELRLEKLSLEMTSGFRRMLDHLHQTEQRIEARLTLIETNIARIEENMSEMASKADLVAMEGRILDQFKQLLTMLDQPPTERPG